MLWISPYCSAIKLLSLYHHFASIFEKYSDCLPLTKVHVVCDHTDKCVFVSKL